MKVRPPPRCQPRRSRRCPEPDGVCADVPADVYTSVLQHCFLTGRANTKRLPKTRGGFWKLATSRRWVNAPAAVVGEAEAGWEGFLARAKKCNSHGATNGVTIVLGFKLRPLVEHSSLDGATKSPPRALTQVETALGELHESFATTVTVDSAGRHAKEGQWRGAACAC